MVKVICFDVGGVLIRITRLWTEAAKRAGVTISPDVSANTRLWDVPFFLAYEGGELDDAAYFRELADYLGGISPADAERVHNHIMMEPYSMVDQIVIQLNDQGYITACLSNTNEPHWHDMFHSGRFPANEALQVRMASHLVGAAKPDAQAFEAFEAEVGASGAEIAYFEDSPPNIAAASSRGWQTFLIDPEQPTAIQIAVGLKSVGIEVIDAMNPVAT